jgi:hypothetical protein
VRRLILDVNNDIRQIGSKRQKVYWGQLITNLNGEQVGLDPYDGILIATPKGESIYLAGPFEVLCFFYIENISPDLVIVHWEIGPTNL